jgi:acetylornithine/N-succinyldiaminopimelate aminotransferase
MPTYAPFDVSFERGEGAYLFDFEGKKYLDFASGIAVTGLGHAHPHLVEMLRQQAGKLWHTSNMYKIPEQERLADRLVAATCFDSVFFTNSGVEAMECSLKLIRKYHFERGETQRFRVISFTRAFHGRSLATIATAKSEKLTKGFGPLPDGFDQVPFLDIEATKAAITDETAAILIEPVQGEGGIIPVKPDDLKKLRELADEHGLLLVLDEIQCGMGRSGRLFAFEWSEIEPDVIALAKGIGGGFPVGACLAKAHVAAAFKPGSHGTTYGGNPLAMAVGNAVLDEVLKPGFLDSVVMISHLLRQGLEELKAKHGGLITEVRGLGLMIGLELTIPIRPLLETLIEEGMLAAAAGDKVMRLLPPMIISEAEVEEALEKLDRVLDAASKN